MFSWTKEGQKRLNKWLLNHNKKCPYSNLSKTGPVRGGLTFTFTPTTLGTVTVVRCLCGKETDLTDYDSW